MESRRKDITEKAMAVKISRSYREDLTAAALYDAARGYWKVDFRRANMRSTPSASIRALSKRSIKIGKRLPAGSIPRPDISSIDDVKGDGSS